MVFKDSVVAVKDFGIAEDSHAKDGNSRQVLLIDYETLDRLDLGPGVIKENITISGLSFQEILTSDLLSIGDEVVLKVSGICKPCYRMDEIRQGLQNELEGKRGVLSRVIKGGIIRVNDKVRIGTSK